MPRSSLQSCLVALLFVAVSPHLMEAAQQHEIELEQAARTYRIHTYRKFRHDRPEYDRRMRRVRELVDGWRDGERSPSEAHTLAARLLIEVLEDEHTAATPSRLSEVETARSGDDTSVSSSEAAIEQFKESLATIRNIAKRLPDDYRLGAITSLRQLLGKLEGDSPSW